MSPQNTIIQNPKAFLSLEKFGVEKNKKSNVDLKFPPQAKRKEKKIKTEKRK